MTTPPGGDDGRDDTSSGEAASGEAASDEAASDEAASGEAASGGAASGGPARDSGSAAAAAEAGGSAAAAYGGSAAEAGGSAAAAYESAAAAYGPRREGDPTFLSQLATLRAAFERDQVRLGVGYDAEGAPAFVYEEHHLLTRERDADEVMSALRDRGVGRPQRAGEAVAGVVRIQLGDATALTAVAAVETAIKRPRIATCNHIVSVAPQGKCPADEPIPVPGMPQKDLVNPGRNLLAAVGAGVAVTVLDNGLAEKYDVDFNWLLDGVTGDVVPDDGVIDEYEGHGTFIAGLLRCVAPALDVHVSASLTNAGAMTELDFCGALLSAITSTSGAPAIVSVSAGGTTALNQPYLGLDAVVDALAAHPETLLVAAAGNNGNSVPFWPAALAGPYPRPVPGVVSVGALRQDGAGMACFSNHGAWVTVYAPGERLVNVFGSGAYTYAEPQSADCRHVRAPRLYDDCTCRDTPALGSGDTFTGLARWSGTSFATPIVAGMVAARMSQTGETSREAALALLDQAGAIDSLGPVLLPLRWTPAPVRPGT